MLCELCQRWSDGSHGAGAWRYRAAAAKKLTAVISTAVERGGGSAVHVRDEGLALLTFYSIQFLFNCVSEVFFVSRVGLSLVGYVAHCDERWRVLFRITYVNAR